MLGARRPEDRRNRPEGQARLETYPFRRPRRRLLSSRARPHQRGTRRRWSTPPTNGSSQRTGIEQRHIAADGETTSILGIKAAQAALADAGLTADGHRPHHRRHLDAGLHLPVDGDADPGRARHHHGAAFDIQAVCSGFVYARGDRRQVSRLRLAQARAGHRRRDLLAHPRLERPHHLRAVRRRRRRGRAGGAEGRGHVRRSRRPDARICAPTGAHATSSTSMAGRARPRPPACCGWRARRSSATPSAWSPT